MRIGDGGGSSGPLGDPLAGLQMPPGDPGPLHGVSGQLSSWANSLGSGAAGHRQAASGVVGSAWICADADAAGKSVDQIAQGAATMADAADHASSVVNTCAGRWMDAINKWHQAQGLAQRALADEAAHRSGGAQAAAGMNPAAKAANPAAYATAQAAADGSDGYVSPLRAQATQLGEEAVQEANSAINTGSGLLGEIIGAVNFLGGAPDTKKDDFVKELFDGPVGKTNSVLGGMLTTAMAKSGYSYATLGRDVNVMLQESDAAHIAQWSNELRSGASAQNIVNAISSYVDNAELAKGAFHGQALDDLGKGGLSFLGDSSVVKWGVRGVGGLAIAGDVWTIAHPDFKGAAGTAEQVTAGVNAAATAGGIGLDVAGEGGAALLAANSLDWVPVAGQVIAVGTGLALAGAYIYSHWDGIKHDIGDGVKAVGDAAKAVGHAGSSLLHGAEDLASDIGL